MFMTAPQRVSPIFEVRELRTFANSVSLLPVTTLLGAGSPRKPPALEKFPAKSRKRYKSTIVIAGFIWIGCFLPQPLKDDSGLHRAKVRPSIAHDKLGTMSNPTKALRILSPKKVKAQVRNLNILAASRTDFHDRSWNLNEPGTWENYQQLSTTTEVFSSSIPTATLVNSSCWSGELTVQPQVRPTAVHQNERLVQCALLARPD